MLRSDEVLVGDASASSRNVVGVAVRVPVVIHPRSQEVANAASPMRARQLDQEHPASQVDGPAEHLLPTGVGRRDVELRRRRNRRDGSVPTAERSDRPSCRPMSTRRRSRSPRSTRCRPTGPARPRRRTIDGRARGRRSHRRHRLGSRIASEKIDRVWRLERQRCEPGNDHVSSGRERIRTEALDEEGHDLVVASERIDQHGIGADRNGVERPGIGPDPPSTVDSTSS